MYNWQHKNWTKFVYDEAVIEEMVLAFALETAELKGVIDALPEEVKQDTIVRFMLDEALKTSAIEGEYYSREDVMSSIKNHIDIKPRNHRVGDISARSIGELMVDVRNSYNATVTEELITTWHHTLFAHSKSINAGAYRSGSEPMVIVSGTHGREIIHYEAPPSARVPAEMKLFIDWYNQFDVHPNDIKHALIKTSIAHLYFESIHPFEDGNGRIGRVIAEKCLAECLDRPMVMSLSTTLEQNKSEYYDALKQAQSGLEVTEWIYYFTRMILISQQQAKTIIHAILQKAHFLDRYKSQMNERQLKIILKMFDLGADNFEGGMSARKYTSIAKVSKATATRDLSDLVEKSILISTGAGRSVRYALNL